jgi:hypothetical protein
VHGYIVWTSAATALLALVVGRTIADQGYQFSNGEIQAAQLAAAALVVGMLCLVEVRLRKFAISPPAFALEESLSDRRFLNLVRIFSFGSFIGVMLIGVLLRNLGG